MLFKILLDNTGFGIKLPRIAHRLQIWPPRTPRCNYIGDFIILLSWFLSFLRSICFVSQLPVSIKPCILPYCYLVLKLFFPCLIFVYSILTYRCNHNRKGELSSRAIRFSYPALASIPYPFTRCIKVFIKYFH